MVDIVTTAAARTQQPFTTLQRRVITMRVDLEDLASVTAFARGVRGLGFGRIDYLVLNAGIARIGRHPSWIRVVNGIVTLAGWGKAGNLQECRRGGEQVCRQRGWSSVFDPGQCYFLKRNTS